MNFYQLKDIPEILNKLTNVSSTIEKKKILKETKFNDLRYIFKQTYDSFINYGTVKIDTSDLSYNENRKIDREWLTDLKNLLYKLENRKLTGNEARKNIRSFLNQSPKIWANIILNILKKDLRIGASKKIINSVYNNLFVEDFCMSAMKYDSKHVSFPVYTDIKLDGIRCIATVDENIKLFSRNGREFKNYPFISEDIKKLKFLNSKYKLDGEIVSSHFQKLMKTVSRKKDGIELAKDAVYNIFDIIIPHEKFNKRLEFLKVLEKTIVEKKLKYLKIVKGKIINDENELLDFYKQQIELKNEGIMIKNLNNVYEFKRTNSWMKMKNEETIDLKIVDFQEGNGKHSGKLGAFICELPNGNLVNVGSGFEDYEREEYWKKRKELIYEIIECKYQEKTLDGSLRFPIFLRLRQDK